MADNNVAAQYLLGSNAPKPQIKRTDRIVTRLIGDYGGREGQEGALLNGLLALGLDPNLVRSLADADPNRRYLDDAVTRALRAGITEDAIRRALQATRAAATGDPQAALRALGVTDPNQLPPENRAAFDAIANRQPLPFLERGQTAPVSAAPMAGAGFPGTTYRAPAPLPGDVRQVENRNTAPRPAAPAGAPPGAPPPGPSMGTTVTAAATPGLKALPTLSPNAPPEEVERYIRKWYGFAAWLLDIPDVRNEMIQLARDFAGTDINELTVEGRLKNTQWWKTHEGDQRLAIEEKMTDPATYNAKVEGKYRTLASLAGQIGFTVADERLRQMAITAYDGGWNDVEMRAALAAEFDYNPDTGAQDQSAIVGDLRQIASDYLVPLSEQTIDQWGRQIIAGTATNEAFTQYARTMAKGMFAHYASDIDAGRTVKQIADPFVQMAARDLELTPDQINLEDSKWRRALEVDPETGQPMQLSKWQRMLRSDSSYGWDYTQNARAEASEFGQKIAEAFGRA